jgi:hypothetical protein
MVIFFGYEELGPLVLGGGRGHDEEEAWFGHEQGTNTILHPLLLPRV